MNEILAKIDQEIPKYNPEVFWYLNDEWRRLVGFPNYYRWLWAAIKVIQPKYVVEIGRERGVSTAIMLETLRADGKIVSIDINPEAIFLEKITDERLVLYTNDSEVVARRIPMGIDFLFIDGEHTKEKVEAEWEAYKPLLAKKAVVVFDDIHFNDGMTEFWDSLAGEKYDISQWHEPGFGVLFL